MNTVIEQRLRDLLEESRHQCAPAAHVVAHMLLACYLDGTQNDFAKWVCQYSTGISLQVGVEGGRPILPGELPLEPALEPTVEPEDKQWVC